MGVGEGDEWWLTGGIFNGNRQKLNHVMVDGLWADPGCGHVIISSDDVFDDFSETPILDTLNDEFILYAVL